MKGLLLLPALLLILLFGTPAFADFAKGSRAYKSGDYATALREWRPLAEQGDPNAQYNLGVLYADGQGVTKDYKTAVKWYELAAEQGHISAQVNLAFMYANGKGVNRDFTRAFMWWDVAASQGNKKAVEWRGEVETKLSATEIKKAKELARECVAKNYKDCGGKGVDINRTAEVSQKPRSPILHAASSSSDIYNKGMEYAVKGNFDRAKKEFDKALIIAPYMEALDLSIKTINEFKENKLKREPAILFFKGALYASKGQYRQALGNYNKALEIEPSFTNAYINRGLLYRGNKQDDLALKDYTRALEIEPTSATAYNNRGVLYRIKGQYELAISDYNNAIKIDPMFAGAYFNLGVIYHRYQNQYNQAVHFYSKAIETNPNYPDAYDNRGHVYIMKLRDKAMGCSDFSKACKLGQCKNYRTAKQHGYCS